MRRYYRLLSKRYKQTRDYRAGAQSGFGRFGDEASFLKDLLRKGVLLGVFKEALHPPNRNLRNGIFEKPVIIMRKYFVI